jgi:hypothetical protein
LHYAWSSLSKGKSRNSVVQSNENRNAASATAAGGGGGGGGGGGAVKKDIKTEKRVIKKLNVKDSTPVLLITDIGADIDDTFALLTSLGSKHAHLVGVVMCLPPSLSLSCMNSYHFCIPVFHQILKSTCFQLFISTFFHFNMLNILGGNKRLLRSMMVC